MSHFKVLFIQSLYLYLHIPLERLKTNRYSLKTFNKLFSGVKLDSDLSHFNTFRPCLFWYTDIFKKTTCRSGRLPQGFVARRCRTDSTLFNSNWKTELAFCTDRHERRFYTPINADFITLHALLTKAMVRKTTDVTTTQ